MRGESGKTYGDLTVLAATGNTEFLQDGISEYVQPAAPDPVPETNAPELTPEQLEEQRIAEIKQVAYEFIVERYPEWKQRNMLAEASYLDRNDPSNPRILELEAVWEWVQRVRSVSDAAEANGTAVNDIVWPL